MAKLIIVVDKAQDWAPFYQYDGVMTLPAYLNALSGKSVHVITVNDYLAKRDADWGPVVLVGLGGIWIEALKDVRLIPADMAEDDIAVELSRLKAAVVLQGIRGAAAVDLQAIARVVAQVGAQMRANPNITEIDINPLVAYPLGSAVPVLALDALVVAQVGKSLQ